MGCVIEGGLGLTLKPRFAPEAEHFLKILLQRHDKAWLCPTPTHSGFCYCLANFALKSCPLYVATYVK